MRRPTLLYSLLAVLGMIVLGFAIARGAGWIGVVDKISVSIAIAERTDIISSVTAYGTVQPAHEVIIQAGLSGEVVKILVEEGDTVEAGQQLAIIRPDQIDTELDRVRAVVEQRRAAWEEARALAKGAQAQFRQATAAYRRSRTLHLEAVMADAEWEKAQAHYHTTQQETQAAGQRAEAARHAMQEAQAEVQQVLQRRRLTQVHSPRKGTVVKRYVDEGERVVGTDLLEGTNILSIATLEKMEVQVVVEESDMLRMAKGQPAHVRLSALPERLLSGTVTNLAYQALPSNQPGDQAFMVHVALDSLPVPLRIGMSAEVDIMTQQRTNTLTVPLLAASTRRSPNVSVDQDSLLDVLFVYRRGRVEQRHVQWGIHNRERIEVLDGLVAGEAVVSGPYQAVSHQLRDEQPVIVLNSEQPLLTHKP